MSANHKSYEYFEHIAEQWDTLRAGYFTEEVAEAAIRKAYLLPEMVVADVGAGTGFMAGKLAPLVRKVYLLDSSPSMLEVARKNLAAFTNTEFHVVDGQSLSLPDESVDAVFANMYLHHCPEPLSAIREMARILKPGGRLVITDADSHPYEWMRTEMADVWLGFERNQIREWFKNADLVNILVDCTGQNCCAQSNTAISAEDKTAKVSIFVATGTKRIRMREKVEAIYTQAVENKSCCGNITQTIPGAEPQSCCCSSEVAPRGDIFGARLYSNQELITIPLEAGEISFGCGNPVAIANLKPGEVVLDIGSGGGIDAFLATRRVGPQGHVIGVDMTPTMLARARESARKAGISNVEFRQGQAEKLPLETGTVDVIISNCVINLCEDKGAAFDEAFRVLRAGGRLELSDMLAAGAIPVQARLDAGEWAGCISGALPEDEYIDLIRQAGFTDINVQHSNIGEEVAGVKVFSALISARKPKLAS